MPIWTQIDNTRVTSVPPDGTTTLDVYSQFFFSNGDVPEGALVTFIIGKGALPKADITTSGERADPVWTLDQIVGSISPIEGIQLISESGEKGFQCVGVVQNRLVKDENGILQILPVAKCSIVPIDDILVDEFTIIAYSDFDKTGTISRLQPQQLQLTVMSGEGVFLSVVEKYDPTANTWTEVEPMITGRAGLFSQTVGSKIYAIGGFNGNFVDVNEEYDPITDAWTAKSVLPKARGYGSSVVVSGKIYIIGGYSFDIGRTSSDLHSYEPSSDTWTKLASIPIPLSHSIAQVVGTSIYVMYGVAGFVDNDGSDETPKNLNFGVFKYDTVLDSWEILDTDTSAVSALISTPLLSATSIGDTSLSVSGSTAFFPNGTIMIDRSGSNEETAIYTAFDATNGVLTLSSPLSIAHISGETVHMTSIPENRVGANSLVDGTEIKIFNGHSFLGFSGSAPVIIRGSVSTFDTATGIFKQITTSPNLNRLRGGGAFLSVSGSSRMYVVGGSGEKSDFLDETEFFDFTSGLFIDTFGGGKIAEMLFARHSIGVSTESGFIYAIGGGGAGHPPGWLKISVTTNPSSITADGKQTSGVLIEAVDASGDPPPDGTEFRAAGIVYVKLTDEERKSAQEELQAIQDSEGAVESSTGEGTLSPPHPKTSILPVLFSSRTMFMIDGAAATILLARSEDPIKEIENLFQFTKNNEEVPTQDALKKSLGEPFRNSTQTPGLSRNLYVIAVEISVIDDFFFGQTDTNGTIAGTTSRDLSSTSDGFTFNPQTAQQGLSGKVSFTSNVASIPDVQLLTSNSVDSVDAKDLLDSLEDEIPFGASPHYDAMFAGAEARNVPLPVPPLEPPQNIMISASDNDESFSSNSPINVTDEANGVAGKLGFPIFVNTFIVTDPISLAARRARTDVADLEFISFETGGNSFSVVDATFIDFVIQRINTSAPSSISSGIILATRAIEGTLVAAKFTVEGVPGNEGTIAGAATNSAEMRIFTSLDNYNFEDLGVVIPPNTAFAISNIKTKYIRYEIILRSETFDSPILKVVNFDYVEDNVQFIFTFPQSVSGQISELAGTANHRLPSGGSVEIGLFHGDSVMFDRDYENVGQPSVSERGTIMAVNRSFDTFIGDNSDESTRDRLDTNDFLVYRSRSGPWSQEAVTKIFINSAEILSGEFLVLPEEGVVAFRKKLSESDVVEMEVQLPATFKVGLKITNPTLQRGKLDEFAFMYGATQDDSGIKLNRSPNAVNLFIGPEPVIPGGPIEANFTFVDPDGDEEDKTETEINWFRNSAIVPEVKNLRSFSNSDLIAGRIDAESEGTISKGQEWFFTVRPSDGKSFGPLVTSHKIIVANLAPTVENARLESSNNDPTIFTSSDTIVALFDFVDQDGDESKGTTYTWTVDGVEVKTGAENAIDPDETDDNGVKLLRPNTTIQATIFPSDGTDFGIGAITGEVLVGGTPPEAKSVSILPSAPSTISNLSLKFQFVDEDGGEDISTVAWFKNDQRISEIDNAREVNSLLTAPGEKWQAIVTPKNAFAEGEPIRSNVVVIQF